MGVQLDVLVEKVIFGRDFVLHPGVTINGRRVEIPTWLLRDEDPNDPPKGICAGCMPTHYSGDWNRALEIERELGRHRFWMNLKSPWMGSGASLWECFFSQFGAGYARSFFSRDGREAVCGAALLAYGVPESVIEIERSQA